MERFCATLIKKMATVLMGVMLISTLTSCADVSRYLPGINVDSDLRLDPNNRVYRFTDEVTDGEGSGSTTPAAAKEEKLNIADRNKGLVDDYYVHVGTVDKKDWAKPNNIRGAVEERQLLHDEVQGLKDITSGNNSIHYYVYYSGYEKEESGDMKELPAVKYTDGSTINSYIRSTQIAEFVWGYLGQLECNRDVRSIAANQTSINLIMKMNAAMNNYIKSQHTGDTNYTQDMVIKERDGLRPSEVKAWENFSWSREFGRGLSYWMFLAGNDGKEITWASFCNYIQERMSEDKNQSNPAEYMLDVPLYFYSSSTNLNQQGQPIRINPTDATAGTNLRDVKQGQRGIAVKELDRFCMNVPNQFDYRQASVVSSRGAKFENACITKYYADGYTKACVIVWTTEDAFSDAQVREIRSALADIKMPDE